MVTININCWYKDNNNPIIDGNNELIFNFFMYFARFECCLKNKSEFLTKDNRDNAKPDWDKFGKQNKKIINEIILSKEKKISSAIEYLFDNPPKKQVVINQFLDWKENNDLKVKNSKNLILILKTIRNNLFHWWKFNWNLWFWTENDKNLLKYWITIINELVNIDNDIKMNYYEWLYFNKY